jgi:hypothetical protein
VLTTQYARDPKKADASGSLLFRKFNPVKTQKKIVQVLIQELDRWFAKSEQQDAFMACYEFLAEKGKNLLEQDEETLANSLI